MQFASVTVTTPYLTSSEPLLIVTNTIKINVVCKINSEMQYSMKGLEGDTVQNNDTIIILCSACQNRV